MRLEKGMTQDDVVRELQLSGIDMSRRSYSYIETGQQIPRVNEVLALCRILSIDLLEVVASKD